MSLLPLSLTCRFPVADQPSSSHPRTSLLVELRSPPGTSTYVCAANELMSLPFLCRSVVCARRGCVERRPEFVFVSAFLSFVFPSLTTSSARSQVVAVVPPCTSSCVFAYALLFCCRFTGEFSPFGCEFLSLTCSSSLHHAVRVRRRRSRGSCREVGCGCVYGRMVWKSVSNVLECTYLAYASACSFLPPPPPPMTSIVTGHVKVQGVVSSVLLRS